MKYQCYLQDAKEPFAVYSAQRPQAAACKAYTKLKTDKVVDIRIRPEKFLTDKCYRIQRQAVDHAYAETKPVATRIPCHPGALVDSQPAL